MTVPKLSTLLPNFSLPDLQGRERSLWDYKHVRPVVLVFCSAGDEALLDEFAGRYPAYREENAQVLALMPQQPRRTDLPFPVLIDREQGVTARCVARTPAVLILDSYNELNARFPGPWDDGVPHRRILGAVAEVELKCPECGVPEWPQRDWPGQ